MSDATVPMVSEIGEVEFRDPFDVVYHREFRSMVRMASALVDSPEQAEEVVQDAFAALYLRYRLVNDPVAYARVSVLNGCRKVLRRRRIVRRQPPPTAESSELGYNHVLDADAGLDGRRGRRLVDSRSSANHHVPPGHDVDASVGPDNNGRGP